MGHPHNELHNIFIDKKENIYISLMLDILTCLQRAALA